jgi:dephospho-CoA kinase
VRRVALTGGIATGKSYCLGRFAEAGAATIDADALARQAVAPGTAGFRAVVARFGAAIVLPDGSLDRAALGRLVFADQHARRALEAIVHPAVYGAITRWFETTARAGRATAAIADIPLLFETGRDGDFDDVIVTACPPALQLARLMARDGLPEDEARRRLESQWPIDEKRARANYVIDTSGSFSETDEQVRAVWAKITAGASGRR